MNKFFDLNPSIVSELAEKCKGNQKHFYVSEPSLKSLIASVQQYTLLLALKQALKDEWTKDNNFENLVDNFQCILIDELITFFDSESERLQNDVKNLLNDEAAEQEKIRHILEKVEAYSKMQTAINSKPVSLNRVPDNLICKTSNSNIFSISIPDPKSKSGFGKIYVKYDQISDLRNSVDKTPINKKNIDLGAADCMLFYYYTDKNGNLVTKQMTAQQVVDIFNENISNYNKANSPKEVSGEVFGTDMEYEN